MCGIVGYISKRYGGLASVDGEIMRHLLYADTVRGVDGTGLVYEKRKPNDKGNTVFYKKDPVAATDLIVSKADARDTFGDTHWCIGHNRAATIGKMTRETTHPFLFDNVYGVHNGTVSGWRHMFEPVEGVESDSAALYNSMDKVGSDPADVTKFLSRISTGAYSLVWYDVPTKTVRFARNSQRPMTMVETSDALWFGSELDMLKWLLNKHNERILNTLETETHRLIVIPTKNSDAKAESVTYQPRYISHGTSYNLGTAPVLPFRDDFDDDPFGPVPMVRDPQHRTVDSPPFLNVERDVVYGDGVYLGAERKADTVEVDAYSLTVTKTGKLPEYCGKSGKKLTSKMHSKAQRIVGAGLVKLNKKGIKTIPEQMRKVWGNQSMDSILIEVFDMQKVPGRNWYLMYGMYQEGKYKVPVELRTTSLTAAEQMEKLLRANRTAIITGVELGGIQYMHNGHVAPYFRPLYSITTINTDRGQHHFGYSAAMYPGPILDGKAGLADKARFGTDNPIKRAREAQQPDWEAGWMAA